MRNSLHAPRFAAAGLPLVHSPESVDFRLPATFGSSADELRAAREGCALLDASVRGAVRARGGDAAEFLHRLLANDVRGLAPGQANANLLLSPKGRVRFAFDLERDAREIRLSTPPGDAAALVEALDAFLFGELVELSDETERHAPLELVGPRAEVVLAALLGCAPELPPASWLERDWTPPGKAAPSPLRLTRIPLLGDEHGWRLDAGAAHAAELWDALVAAGAVPCGLAAREVVRIERRVALAHVEIDEEVYPQEARLEHAFSLSKGCYVGQEVVAKLDTYGGLNRRLVRLLFEDPAPLTPGTPVETEAGEAVGVLTAWSGPPAGDGAQGLALLKLRHAASAKLRVAGTPARVEEDS